MPTRPRPTIATCRAVPVGIRLAVPVAVAAATLLSGCMAVGPYATVKVIEGYEQATGRLLDGRPLPPSAGPVPGGAPGPTGEAGVPGSGVPVSGGTPGPAGAGSPETPGADTATPTPPAGTPTLITLSMYNQLQSGMTYPEVVKILGRDGQLLPNARTKIYVWNNPNGSLVRVIFSADRLADKEQQRLS
jgi:hypothetical protein